jgi:NADH-quinone oxidoreductase subunit L
VGIATSLFAAFSALGQTDLKRVLAYSTVSQLGLMFLAAGVGAFYASMFHLTTHAFVKALLFLSAGNVVHMMHGSTDMEKMGGLKKIFTKTHIFFFLGVLALSGIPPFAIFFSKDLILEQEHQTGHDILFAMGLLVSILTAVYLTRAYVLTFLGEQRLEKKIMAAVHEAPWIMLGPISVLAFLAATGGFLGVSSGRPPLLEMFLEESDVTLPGGRMSTGFHFTTDVLLSMAAGFMGLGVAWVVFTKRRDLKAIPLFKNAFYIDQIYDFLIVNPLNAVSRFFKTLETTLFSGSIDAASSAAYKVSKVFQLMQSGQIRSYISWMLLGIFLIFAFLLIRGPL